ncbi:esterase [Phytohabitans aurantiacus]|uniref:prolyl aminopeptidase n=2 Tax=Phytohabitans aurantiacus TaxID=3016789 RepID=A0ABQ5QLE0_9ACTN|nr:esterase [Phytohabitans aurantiacus]
MTGEFADREEPQMRAPRARHWAGIVVTGVVCAMLGPASQPASAETASAEATVARVAATPAGPRPRLTDSRPCAGIAGFTCSYLTVPRDRTGHTPGTLRLPVAVADNTAAPRGTLLMLSGGPGQPGVGLVPRIRQRVSYLLNDYRMVMIDQRGTGEGAIDCERLQAEVGSSDITPPSREAVRECARQLGQGRHHYTTADTVADLEDLRQALDVSRWTIDGVSYGTFVAQHYALTFPGRVSRMVLDSVVPLDIDPLYVAGLRRTGWMLRQACQEQNCGFDPAAALAGVVRRYDNGVGVFDLIVIASIVDPKLTGEGYFPVLPLLRLAAQGEPEPLNQAIAALQGGQDTPPAEYSAGLHVATLCADLVHAPWGNSMAPLWQRDAAVAEARRNLSARQVWPFEPQTAVGNGIVQACRYWPPARANPQPPRHRLTMPVLLINGDRDLSTPLEWAVERAAQMPRGELVIIPGMGHSIQGRNAAGDQAVQHFLLH